MIGLKKIDVAVIGAGPAGIAAAIGAREEGAERVVVYERDWELGGILQQCIHPGFGMHTFGAELTGPEYTHRYLQMAADAGVEFITNSMVFQMEKDGSFHVMNPERGIEHVHPGATVLCMGCRERPAGALPIAGSRPAGIYTAGTAQRFVNMEGFMPGKRVVVLGTGDIGLIMARRMILEGATVEGVFELMSWPGGLRRNIAQCLDDYKIPWYLEHTIVAIHGHDRVEGVTVARVDAKREPITGTHRRIACDTLLLAVGLIPENELSMMAGIEICPETGGPRTDERFQTSIPGVFAAGNVAVVYDLVDWVSSGGRIAGKNAARFAAGKLGPTSKSITVRAGDGVRLVSPQQFNGDEDFTLFFRVSRPFETPCRLTVEPGIHSSVLRYARPGEMIELKLDNSKLQRVSSGAQSIEICVKEV